jgi:hypothetical protein
MGRRCFRMTMPSSCGRLNERDPKFQDTLAYECVNVGPWVYKYPEPYIRNLTRAP